MAALTLTDVRALIREHLDIDDEDLSDLLLDGFIREAYEDILSSQDSWSFLQFERSWLTVPDQQRYDLATLFGETPPLRVRAIHDVRSDTEQLRPRDHRQMREAFWGALDTTGRPYWYSLWDNHIYLWRTPDSEIQMTLTGYREPHDWISDGAGAVPDAPEEFHYPIALTAVAMAYAQQDDPEMAVLFSQRAENRLRRLRKPYLRGLDAQPLVMNRGNRGSLLQKNGLALPLMDW